MSLDVTIAKILVNLLKRLQLILLYICLIKSIGTRVLSGWRKVLAKKSVVLLVTIQGGECFCPENQDDQE